MDMKFIRSKTHAWLDYIYGIFLAISPWVFGFATGPNGEPQTLIPVFLGAATIVFSLCTDYELGVISLISIKMHLAIDFLMGIFLAASPWLFNFHDEVWMPHVAFGLIAVLVSLCTTSHRAPQQSSRDHHAAIVTNK
jgi:hypothetical protein